MATIYISIGSNIDRARNIRGGVAALRRRFHALRLSRVYESAAIGFTGDAFYNLVAAAVTDEDVDAVVAALHAIEDSFGRERGGPRFASRTLDMDLLLYDDLVAEGPGYRLPRDEITRHAFVLRPLAELAPDLRHPVLQRSFASLWRDFDASDQPLAPVDFSY